ncbi:MAG: hypothetical protein O7B99_12010 [Planctomycetota bacterium]|nr:hypothetical protein [Planctomycetota bacterium]
MRQSTTDESGPDSGLRARCARLVRQRAFLVDPDRLRERTLLRADGGIDAALEELLAEDEEAERAGLPLEDPWSSPYAFLIQGFGTEPRLARTAAVRFNGLGERTRRVFFALLLEQLDDDACFARGLGPPAALQEDLFEALRALLLLADP